MWCKIVLNFSQHKQRQKGYLSGKVYQYILNAHQIFIASFPCSDKVNFLLYEVKFFNTDREMYKNLTIFYTVTRKVDL